MDLTSPQVMGIVNVTPDSFYGASRVREEQAVLKRVERILSEGAGIIDIGGYSTRPSADFVSTEEEIKRVSRSLESICREFPDLIISVDTFRSQVASEVLKHYPVAIINDVSGGSLDERMFETMASTKAAYVLMHMRGTPQNMQEKTRYEDVVVEVLQDLQQKLVNLRALGVHDVIVDPGFGFAKTLEQNYLLLKELAVFRELEAPILVGISRKSMIQKLLNVNADEALNGTTAAHMLALAGGASILRVHDVKEAVQAVKIYTQTYQA